jgi:plastocyanin
VVPVGTQARLAVGETVTIMPSEISLRVGDTLRIRNEDVVDQAVGPYVVAAGETVEMTYGTPGRYEGMCPLSEGSTYLIEITE